MSRHKDPHYFLLSTKPNNEDKHIKGNKLPTRKEVLLAFIVRKEEIQKSYNYGGFKLLHSAALSTVREEIVRLYEICCIPMKSEENMALEILKMYETMQNVMKISPAHRESESSEEKISTFKNLHKSPYMSRIRICMEIFSRQNFSFS